MRSLFNYSFFITQNMKTQLREGPVYGTLPILYVFLARTGKSVHEFNLVSLDEQGNLQIADALAPDHVAPRSAAPGVKIVFSDGTGPKQTLYYFSTNLADGSFERSGFLAFLAKQGPSDSLLKSASYLLHKPHFSGVRKLLLDRSATIVQDDSGIPLTYLETKRWRLRAFGHTLSSSRCPQAYTSPEWQRCFKAPTRSNSGLDIDGARTNRMSSSLKAITASSEEELSPQSQAEGSAKEAAAPSPKKARKRTEATWSFGCRMARVFPFCW